MSSSISDDRFKKALSGPLFKKIRRKERDNFDSRFTSVGNDERFPTKSKKSKATVRADENTKGIVRKSNNIADDTDIRLDYLTKLSRGEIEPDCSSSDSESSESNEGERFSSIKTESCTDDIISEMPSKLSGAFAVQSETVILQDNDTTTATSSRIAIQNCNWDHLSAEDLMVVLQSFAGTNSDNSDDKTAIKSVTVYVSDYGKNQMEAELRDGPDRAIWEPNVHSSSESISGSDDISETETASIENNAVEPERIIDNGKKGEFRRGKGAVGVVMEDDLVHWKSKHSSTQIDSDVALRRYELNKLRYYFAIAECRSVNVAEQLCAQLDQVEFEGSSMILDLSLVPLEMSFEGRQVRDFCDAGTILSKLSAAENSSKAYQPPDFVVNALQHTKVKCTWDEGDTKRERLLTNFSKWRDLNESEVQQYLASSDSSAASENTSIDDFSNNGSDDSSVYEEKAVMRKRKHSKSASKIRQLLLGGDDDKISNDGDDFFVDDKSIEESATLTYVPDVDKHKIDQKREMEDKVLNETPYEASLRKTKTIQKAKKEARKVKQQNSEIVNSDSRSNDEPSRLSKRKKKSTIDTNVTESNFEIDVKDNRFSKLFEGNANFGIDKTVPEFKESDAMKVILKEQMKRRRSDESVGKKNNRNFPTESLDPELPIIKLAKKLKSKFS